MKLGGALKGRATHPLIRKVGTVSYLVRRTEPGRYEVAAFRDAKRPYAVYVVYPESGWCSCGFCTHKHHSLVAKFQHHGEVPMVLWFDDEGLYPKLRWRKLLC